MNPDGRAGRGVRAGERRLVLTRTLLSFQRQGGADAAASLTYLAFLALFPITLTVVSALAIATDHVDADDTILAVVAAVAPPAGVEALRGPLQQLSSVPLPGLALAIGVALTLWTVSAYAACFGRALNRFYGVEEGRSFLRVRLTMLLLAVPLATGGAAVVAIVLTTPRIGRAVASTADVDAGPELLWQVVKWPLLLGILALMLGALYRWTPNVRRQGVSPIGWGALLAILGWAVLSLGFALYVTGLGHYRVYGWLTGALVITLWLHLSDLVLVLGASLDTEVVRMRQLRDGLSSESLIRAPLRDDRRAVALRRRQDAVEAASRAVAVRAAAEAHLPWAPPVRAARRTGSGRFAPLGRAVRHVPPDVAPGAPSGGTGAAVPDAAEEDGAPPSTATRTASEAVPVRSEAEPTEHRRTR